MHGWMDSAIGAYLRSEGRKWIKTVAIDLAFRDASEGTKGWERRLQKGSLCEIYSRTNG